MRTLLRPIYRAVVPGKVRTYRAYFNMFRRKFGARHSVVPCSRFLLGRGGTVELPLPGFPSNLVLRRESTDPTVFEDVFLRDEMREADGLGSPRLILDLGAYTGLTTAYMARLYPGAEIFAVEAEDSNYRLLLHNASGFANVHPLNEGIWSHRTRLRLRNPSAEAWAYEFEECGPDEGIPTTTIDEILERSGQDGIDFIKMNVEGAEREVFAAGGRWLSATRSMFVDLHEHLAPGAEAAVFSAAEKHGFSWRRRENVVLFQRA